jgi:hypothetical protein
MRRAHNHFVSTIHTKWPIWRLNGQFSKIGHFGVTDRSPIPLKFSFSYGPQISRISSGFGLDPTPFLNLYSIEYEV